MKTLKHLISSRIFKEPSEDNVPVFVIRPSKGWISLLNFRELRHYKDLLYILIWREIKVRYKQTTIGIGWAVLQPFLAMVIFSIFFGRLAKIPSEGIPYPIFSYCALLPWQFFSKALTEASTCLVTERVMVTKIYFPRLLLPTSIVLAGLLDFGIAFLLLLGMIAFYGITLSWTALVAPLFLILAIFAALGISYWLSALDAIYRDVRYTLPLLTQLWLFASPIVYPSSMVPEAWRTIYGINPMVSVIEGFRWSLLGQKPPDPAMFTVSCVTVGLIFVIGLIYFRRTERTLADKV